MIHPRWVHWGFWGSGRRAPSNWILCLSDPSPHELLERKELFCCLCAAFNSLSEMQGCRVDACVILGKSYREVAMAEGVSKTAVQESVQSGLAAMRKIMKKFCEIPCPNAFFVLGIWEEFFPLNYIYSYENYIIENLIGAIKIWQHTWIAGLLPSALYTTK